VTDTPRAILERARMRIFDITHWTGNASAEMQHGGPCEPRSPDAKRWNGLGALNAEASSDDPAAYIAAAFLRRAATELFGVESISVSSRLGHGPDLMMYGRALELAAEAEIEAATSRVGVGSPASSADHAADHVLGLDQGGRAPNVRPVADEADRAHAQAFLHFLEHMRPELRLPLAKRPSQTVKQRSEHKVRNPLGLVDQYIVFLHDRYSRMAAGENVDDAASASSVAPSAPSATAAQRVAVDRALKRAHRVAARLSEQQHQRHADTAENALALTLATVEVSHAFADAVKAAEALCDCWEIG